MTLGGGANLIHQYFAAGLLDEIEIHVSPLLLGSGARLLDPLDVREIKLAPIPTLEGPGVTHFNYRVAQ